MKRWVILAAGLPVLTAAAVTGWVVRTLRIPMPRDPIDLYLETQEHWADFHAGGDGTMVNRGGPLLTDEQWRQFVEPFGAHPAVPPRLDAFTVTEGEQVLTAQQWRERPAP